MKTGWLIGSEVGGDCQLGGACPGHMPRPSKVGALEADEGFPAHEHSSLTRAVGQRRMQVVVLVKAALEGLMKARQSVPYRSLYWAHASFWQ